MAKFDETAIQRNIDEFMVEYGLCMQALISALNDARISHYSSGGGTKSITFDIFPASAYVVELLSMLSLDRPYKSKAVGGYRDASSREDINPANDFIQYLRRWSHFAEQVMQREGDSPLGIAGARAKLIIADLLGRLAVNSQPTSASADMLALVKAKGRRPTESKTVTLYSLLQSIGLALEGRAESDRTVTYGMNNRTRDENYSKAMAAAQGAPMFERNENFPPTRRAA